MLEAKIPTLGEFSTNYIEYQRDVKQKRSWKKDAQHFKRWKKFFGENTLAESGLLEARNET